MISMFRCCGFPCPVGKRSVFPQRSLATFRLAGNIEVAKMSRKT
ncbi:hypothetical protein A21D_02521 [Virgibacillus dokdonensis]|uniref:Uncharacterized protein n=1 Tax=Virgibacillus dokdonensis TaxID=302167 RepID=A0A2K9J0T5_9BACI|nr:hypothetical protein A21D_02521 [Virgibacillus dokdonensis]